MDLRAIFALLSLAFFEEYIGQYPHSISAGIHSAYAVGEGCISDDICMKTQCILQMDGVNYTVLENVIAFGLFFDTFSYPSFTHLGSRHFNTFNGDPGLLVQWINSLKDSTIILGCIRDEGTQAMNQQAWEALESIGLAKPYDKAFRTSLAIIGFKGKWPYLMTRSNTRIGTKAIVSLTYVLPPTNVVVLRSLNNKLNITWKPRSSRFAETQIIYSATNTTSVSHYVETFDSSSGFATIGPLKADHWYNVSVKVPLTNNASHVIAPSKPRWLIVESDKLGCPRGDYEIIFKADGGKGTFGFDSQYWQYENQLLSESAQSTGFDNVECKTSSFSYKKIKKGICAGMKDLATNQLTFTELQVSVEKTMDEWQDNTARINAPVSNWNQLLPKGMPSVTAICKDGFKQYTNKGDFRFGFFGHVNGNCGQPDVVAGYGLKIGGTDCTSCIRYKDSSSYQIKRTFGYILVPYYIDAEWQNWGPWTTCDRSCGTGIRTRFRNSTEHFGGGLILPAYENNTESCKLQDCIPPAPENVIASSFGTGTLKLQWDHIPEHLITNTRKHYKISMTEPSGQQFATTNSNTKYFSSLKPYTVYCFQVALVLQSDIEGNMSRIQCALTDEDVPLDPPLDIKGVNLTSWCLLITWTPIPPTRAQGVVTKYEINYWEDGTSLVKTILSYSNNSQEICGLKPYTGYSLKMSGYTKVGQGPKSVPITGIFTDEYIPSRAPSIISTEHTSSTSLKVTWQSLAVQYWRGIPYGYQVFYVLKDPYTVTGTRDNVSFAQVGYPATQIELVQLEKFRIYVIWMNAFTVKGSGANSTTKEQRTDEDTPMKGPSAIAHNSSSFSIIAHWTQLETKYRLGLLLQYRVFCVNLKTKTEVTLDVGASKMSAEISNLLPFQNHSIEIAGVTSKGVGARGPRTFTLTEEYKPSQAPPNFKAVNISSYALQLNWSLIQDDFRLGIIIGYTILYRETSRGRDDWNVTVVYEENTLGTVINNLTAYTDYTLRIAGFTKMGNGTFSNETIGRTEEDAPYEPPRSINASEIGITGIVINWSAPRSSEVKGIIRGYKIMYTAVYTPLDFKSNLLLKRRRRKRSVISKPLDLKQHNVTVGRNQFQLEINHLQGGTNYSVQILAFTIFDGVACDPLYIFTKESVPAMAPINVTAYNTSYVSLMVKWQHIFPAYAHGDIEGFLVFYQPGNHSCADAYNESQIAQRTYLELTYLNTFAWYTIQVAAYTKVGVGVRSKPVYARTDEWIPSKAPYRVKAKSFMLPYEFDVTWDPLPYEFWHGIPLGYLVIASTISIGGVDLEPSKRIKHAVRVGADVHKFAFVNMKPYYTYSVQISAYTIKGDGPLSPMAIVETCHVARSVLRSSWTDYMPLIEKDPYTGATIGFLPPILLKILKYCSGKCSGLNIVSNATIDFQKDGLGMQARKASMSELLATMSSDTEFIFPVVKPTYPNDKYEFVELVAKSKVVLVEGKPLVNLVGSNVSKSMQSLLSMLLLFILFCLLAGYCIWFLERLRRPEEIRTGIFPGIFDGFYWAFVTATTVGYGDITPTSLLGRIFAMIWSLIGLILVAFLSGALSSCLTSTDESMVKVTTVPKSGLGMVRDSWEFLTAQKKLIKIDKNYSDYLTLLNAVAKGKVKYGMIDKDIASIWAVKFVQDSISVKRTIDLDGGIGMYVTGDTKQLVPCFKTQIKEETAFILKKHWEAIEVEVHHVNLLLKPTTNVSLTVAIKKPAFYSWESQVMQTYIKVGAALVGTSLLLGSVFEVYRKIKNQRKKKGCVKPVFDVVRSRSEDLLPNESTMTRNHAETAFERSYQSLSNLNGPSDTSLYTQLQQSLSTSLPTEMGNANAIRNEALQEETSLLIEDFVRNFEEMANEIEYTHIKERLRLQKLKWDLYGTYKYVDPTDYGVPFE